MEEEKPPRCCNLKLILLSYSKINVNRGFCLVVQQILSKNSHIVFTIRKSLVVLRKISIFGLKTEKAKDKMGVEI